MEQPEPFGPVVITGREIYDQLVKLSKTVETLVAKDRSDEIARTSTDHEVRLRALERWRYALPTALLLSAGSIVGSVIVAILNHV